MGAVSDNSCSRISWGALAKELYTPSGRYGVRTVSIASNQTDNSHYPTDTDCADVNFNWFSGSSTLLAPS